MAGSISAFNNIYASSTASMSSSSKLTDFTKKQLELLGIDASQIKTEAQGIYALLTVKKAKVAKNAKPAQEPKQTIVEEPKDDVKAQSQITSGMTGIANYNRFFHNLC